MAGTNKPSIKTVFDAYKKTDEPAKSSVKKIKAIPFSGGTTVIVRSIDFETSGNIKHEDVTWDFRVDDFTVEVGSQISEEAANFLVEKFPSSFKFV